VTCEQQTVAIDVTAIETVRVRLTNLQPIANRLMRLKTIHAQQEEATP